MNSRTVLDSPKSDRTVLSFPISRNPEAVATSSFAPSYFETDDQARLFYRDGGTGEPVLFVHSWAGNADLWQYQMVHLAAQGLRCVAYDRRGDGRSSDPATVTLVGHSMGCGEIVRYFARHGAGRVRRVAFIASSLPFPLKTADNPEGEEQVVLEQFRAAVAMDFPQWLSANARPFFVPETPQATVDWGINMCLQSSLKAVLDCSIVDAETDHRADLRKLRTPTLIIYGDRDVSTPLERTAQRTARLIPGSELIIYEGGPHGLMLTHVNRLNADLLAFIRN